MDGRGAYFAAEKPGTPVELSGGNKLKLAMTTRRLENLVGLMSIAPWVSHFDGHRNDFINLIEAANRVNYRLPNDRTGTNPVLEFSQLHGPRTSRGYYGY